MTLYEMVKNAFGTGVVLVVGKVLIMLLNIILARSLSIDEYGEYNYFLSIISIMSIPIVAGVNPLVVKEVAKNSAVENFNLHFSSWCIKHINLMFFLILIFTVVMMLLGFTSELFNSYFAFILLIILFRGVLNYIGSIFQSLNYPVSSIISLNVISPLVVIGLLFGYYLFGKEVSVTIVLLFNSVALFICIVFLLLNIKGKYLFSFRSTKKNHLNKQWRSTLNVLMFIGLVTTLNNDLAPFVLGFLATPESVAYFKVAMSGLILMSVSSQANNIIIAPKVSKLFSRDAQEELQLIVKRSANFMLLINTPILIAILFLSSEIISLTFGDKYLASGSSFIILALGQFVNSLFGPVGLILNMSGNERITLKIFIVSLLLLMICMFVLIPTYGDVGAALSVTFSFVFWGAAMSVAIFKKLKLKTWCNI